MKCRFKLNDVVTRMGDDEQVVIGVGDLGDMIEVRCTKPDHMGVFQIGYTECNLERRYELVKEEAT